ncbi:MAG: class I SAM-dependent DNA methyltransferase [Saprospiraceae bacterium]
MDNYQETINTFDKHASGYQEKYMDVSHYGDSLDYLLNLLAPNPSILEIGCGPGNVTRYLLNKRDDLHILGTDMAPKMVELASANNPEARFLLMDAREIDKTKGKFDAVLSAFILPYLSREDVDKLFSDMAALLNERGILYISTMEDEYSKSGYQVSSDGKDRCFQYFHSADDLQSRLEKSGFELIYQKRQVFPPEGVVLATDLIIIARKRE